MMEVTNCSNDLVRKMDRSGIRCFPFQQPTGIAIIPSLNNKRVKITDKKGAVIRCFPFQHPMRFAIIPSLSLLAVSSRKIFD